MTRGPASTSSDRAPVSRLPGMARKGAERGEVHRDRRRQGQARDRDRRGERRAFAEAEDVHRGRGRLREAARPSGRAGRHAGRTRSDRALLEEPGGNAARVGVRRGADQPVAYATIRRRGSATGEDERDRRQVDRSVPVGEAAEADRASCRAERRAARAGPSARPADAGPGRPRPAAAPCSGPRIPRVSSLRPRHGQLQGDCVARPLSDGRRLCEGP